MIGRLRGILLEKKPPNLLIDVNGVGYDVAASMNTIYQLPKEGETVVLHTHMVVREDAQLLYGFYQERERELFRLLIKVNGVGPKLALTILSSIQADDFVFSVHQQDSVTLVKLPGIGKKTAERLIIEMRDRLTDWQGADATVLSDLPAAEQVIVRPSAQQDAISGLIALGYKPQEARRVVASLPSEAQSSAELIKVALKRLAG